MLCEKRKPTDREKTASGSVSEEMGENGQSESASKRAKSDVFGHSMYYQDADYKVVETVTAVAKECGVSNAQVALAWMLHKQHITAPIIGATKMFHLEEAVRATQLKLTPEHIQRLEQPYVPHKILGHS